VVGSSIDDAALAAAPLSINIDPRGGPLERCDIDVVSGDVRDAAVAIQLSRALAVALRSIGIAAGAPVALGVLIMLVGLPAWTLPLLAFAGVLLGTRQLGGIARGSATSGPPRSVATFAEGEPSRPSVAPRSSSPGAGLGIEPMAASEPAATRRSAGTPSPAEAPSSPEN